MTRKLSSALIQVLRISSASCFQLNPVPNLQQHKAFLHVGKTKFSQFSAAIRFFSLDLSPQYSEKIQRNTVWMPLWWESVPCEPHVAHPTKLLWGSSGQTHRGCWVTQIPQLRKKQDSRGSQSQHSQPTLPFSGDLQEVADISQPFPKCPFYLALWGAQCMQEDLVYSSKAQ